MDGQSVNSYWKSVEWFHQQQYLATAIRLYTSSASWVQYIIYGKGDGGRKVLPLDVLAICQRPHSV